MRTRCGRHDVKYMLMFVNDESWEERTPPEERKAGYEAVMKWWGDHSAAGRIVGGEQLKPTATATTVRRRDGRITVTDGPYIESKEALGGFAIVNVADLDSAIALAKSWPGLETVEVRPLVEARDDSGVPDA
jgi:hypothetical protein